MELGPAFDLIPQRELEEEPTTTRDQSMRSAARSFASKTSCNRSQTPAACRSGRRRQQLMPEPQPISCGSASQGIPDCSTNRMPVNTARLSNGLRPGFRGRRCIGADNKDSIKTHIQAVTDYRFGHVLFAKKTAKRLTEQGAN